ncbi:hypothetical protein ACFLY9_02570, partial [Patescibacteria group bacterium]
MSKSKLFKIILIAILLILSFIFCFYNLSRPPLETWDEYTNFNVIYDTVESSSGFNAPALNLSLNQDPFLEKPPLWYYLTM